jgi:hypothetical protein
MHATATLLADGKVLIAGGQSTPSDILASAELYDPSTGLFTPTGSMSTARAEHTATLLSDGRVLIAGGFACPGGATCFPGDVNWNGKPLASAELYDPQTGTFSPTGSMSAARARATSDATATLLPDGRVLFASGGDGLTAEIYDPKTGKFTHIGTGSPFFTLCPAATLLSTGRVLLITNGLATRVFDPQSGALSPTPFTIGPGAAPEEDYVGHHGPESATLLADGRVLMFTSDTMTFDDVGIYDPATGVLTPAGFLAPPGALWVSPTKTLLSDGRMLFAGGDFENVAGPVSYAQLFDPSNGRNQMELMSEAREYQTATLLSDGNVLMAGGTADGKNALSSVELFRP